MSAKYRAGTIAVIGRPNVGKSTLINSLVGAKVSIVSPRPQTTRHRLLGIATFDDGQLMLVDTPGIHAKQSRAMNRYMNRAARGAVSDVDAAIRFAQDVKGPALIWFEITGEQNVFPMMPAGKGLSDLIEEWGTAE